VLDLGFVVTTHDEIVKEFGGLAGFAGGGIDTVRAALARVDNHAYYAGLDDVLGIAALYAEAIARGHVFNDANKRTGLTCAISYLEQQGFTVRRDPILEDLTVMLAEGTMKRDDFAWALGLLAGLNGDQPAT
jgi:death-on-curing protein